MTDKALISELTWRSLQMQREAFPEMPHFVAPNELSELLRPTTRKEDLTIHVVSLGVIADNEKDFRTFLKQVETRRAKIVTKDEGFTSIGNEAHLVAEWRAARKNGAAKIGGRISADKQEAESRKACEAIRAEWPLARKDARTPALLKKAGQAIGKKRINYKTAVKFLGPRPIAQYNYQTKLKRKARKGAA